MSNFIKKIPSEKQIKDFMAIFEEEVFKEYKFQFENIVQATDSPKMKTGNEPTYLEILVDKNHMMKNSTITEYQITIIREKANFLALIPEKMQIESAVRLIFAFKEYNSEDRKKYYHEDDEVNKEKKKLLSKAERLRKEGKSQPFI